MEEELIMEPIIWPEEDAVKEEIIEEMQEKTEEVSELIAVTHSGIPFTSAGTVLATGLTSSPSWATLASHPISAMPNPYEFHPTMEFRYNSAYPGRAVIRNVNYNPGSGVIATTGQEYENILQQKWKNGVGAEEWREVPGFARGY